MKTLINRDNIKSLAPCKDRFDNYINNYGDRSFSKGQFMGLKSITQSDKLWVAFRLMTKAQAVAAAADIAESVLSVYEDKYPGDSRPREAIAAARAWVAAPTEANADAAAYAADVNSARPAANAAYAAASYAYAAAAAANTAPPTYPPAAPAHAACPAYAAAAYAADANSAAAAAYYAAYYADVAYAAAVYYATKPNHEKAIRAIVLKHWKEGK
jgi:hypothetical protein